MIFINRQVNNHHSIGSTHVLQIGYLLLNQNTPNEAVKNIRGLKKHKHTILIQLILVDSVQTYY